MLMAAIYSIVQHHVIPGLMYRQRLHSHPSSPSPLPPGAITGGSSQKGDQALSDLTVDAASGGEQEAARRQGTAAATWYSEFLRNVFPYVPPVEVREELERMESAGIMVPVTVRKRVLDNQFGVKE